jgi:hypothetical protein
MDGNSSWCVQAVMGCQLGICLLRILSVRMNQRPTAFTNLQHLFNDQHGHAAGDQVIKLVANAARQAVREVDLVGRRF